MYRGTTVGTWATFIDFKSIRTRLYLSFIVVTVLTFVAAGIAWTAFHTTEGTLKTLTDKSLPLVASAIELERGVGTYSTQILEFGSVENDAERNKRYLELLDESSKLDDLVFKISEQMGDKKALAGMMDVTATLATSVTNVNNAVMARLAADSQKDEAKLAATEEEVAKQVAAADDGTSKLRELITKHVSDTQAMVSHQIKQALQTTVRGRWLILGVSIAAAVVSVLLGWLYVGRNLIRRLIALVRAMETVAKGDLSIEVPAGGGDEIGAMAEALQVFKSNALEVERLRTEQVENEKRAQDQRRSAMLKLADRCDTSVMTIVESLAGAATEMQATAENLSRLAQEASDQSGAAARGAESTTMNVQAMASAVRQLSVSVREIAERVNESAEIARQAVDQARHTNVTVEGLKKAATHVGEVVSLINDIANQTNLLALNATIEAARAGEAGRGFAIVASEVKQLANQTAGATEEIRQQIESMQRITGDAVGAIDTISTTIQRINEISAAVASAVIEQGAAVDDMARNAQEAADGTSNVSSNIGGVSTASERTGDAAGQVLSASSELATFAERLKREVAEFLHTVRAA